MKSPLFPIEIISIYKNKLGDLLPLPQRMARCTADTFTALLNISTDLSAKGGKLILSDLFRSYEMQTQSHNDYLSGKKKAFSPAPGGSFHESGRAFDLDLGAIKISLSDFWKIARKYGVVPIINEPKKNLSEAWHFECRGSHQIIYDYYTQGKGTNFKPYKAAAASAILSIGVYVDFFGENQKQAMIQANLIRLGKEIGNLDGQIGKNTKKALSELGLQYKPDHLDDILSETEDLVQEKFTNEYRDPILL
ncbi:M15 family metallopeptidase domain-containing protein [Chryseobacterium vrystaatense]|uniref:D-alanyl-D-alanine carboxypeptidase n=1 Tax=Chryseobacterium vrystaatense TaxID=307480 RepID=A0A1M5MAV0_9FLAO|nr:D-alanyl-D-alanine carboxypeptidase family protein [Chryseobacterium vrystaatense]SHG74410.1 D-alanyl-D-alanine carboxypeptidase [Chryseobacterium vrystaatense]